MDGIKDLLAKWATPLISKVVLRGVTYGTAAISAKLAIDAPSSDTQAQVAAWIAAGASGLLGLVIDYFQHRNDKK